MVRSKRVVGTTGRRATLQVRLSSGEEGNDRQAVMLVTMVLFKNTLEFVNPPLFIETLSNATGTVWRKEKDENGRKKKFYNLVHCLLYFHPYP